MYVYVYSIRMIKSLNAVIRVQVIMVDSIYCIKHARKFKTADGEKESERERKKAKEITPNGKKLSAHTV